MFNAWNSIYWNLFQVSDINCLNDISRASGYISISFEIDIRKFSFLHKLQFSDNVVFKDLYNIFGKKEIASLASQYNMTTCSGGVFKTRLWNRFLGCD